MASPSEQLEAAMDRVESSLKDLLGIDVSAGLSLVTGLFVGLVVELARRNGNDPEAEIRIDSNGKRDITIHAKASTYSVLNGTKVLAEDLTEDQAQRLAAAEARAGRQASIRRTSGPLAAPLESATP